MPLPIIANTLRVACSGPTASGTTWANVLHFRKVSGAIDEAARVALRDALVTLYGVGYGVGARGLLNWAPSGTRLTLVVMTLLDGQAASVQYTVNVGGQGTTDPLPAEVAFVLSLRTALRGRRNRGRLYVPQQAEETNDSAGRPNATITAEYPSAANAFRSSLTPLNWEWVVASYGKYDGPVEKRWNAYATPITNISADGYWDTQRRRGLPR